VRWGLSMLIQSEGLSVAVLAMVWYACAVGAFVFCICVELRGLDV
jgi:hypothetical protein